MYYSPAVLLAAVHSVAASAVHTTCMDVRPRARPAASLYHADNDQNVSGEVLHDHHYMYTNGTTSELRGPLVTRSELRGASAFEQC